MRAGRKRGKKPDGDVKSPLQEAARLREECGYGREDEGFTVREYAERFGIGRNQAEREILRLVEAGKLVQGWGRRTHRAAGCRTVRVFRKK